MWNDQQTALLLGLIVCCIEKRSLVHLDPRVGITEMVVVVEGVMVGVVVGVVVVIGGEVVGGVVASGMQVCLFALRVMMVLEQLQE